MYCRIGRRVLFPQLQVAGSRKLCSSKPPPKFEGGERNFFQTDKPEVKPNKLPSFLIAIAKRAAVFCAVLMVVPFFTAYVIETTPQDEFEKAVMPELRTSSNRMRAKLGQLPMTDKEFEVQKQKSLAVYQPYINTLRALGITTGKDADTCKTWDMSDPDISEFRSDAFNDTGIEIETKDSYNFGSSGFNDDGGGNNGETKIW